MILRDIFDIFKDTFDAWNKDHAPRLGAALAYYTVFSLGPLLIIVIAIAGLVFGQSVARQQILAQMQSLVGPQGVEFIILFFGAGFTKVFATRYGRGIVPAPNAVRVTEEIHA